MAPRIDQGTLEQYLKDNNLTIIERQPASMVPPIYRGKPKEEQVLTGVHGVEEILFSDGTSKCICSDCTNVFDTASSANAHRSRCLKVKDVKTAEKQARDTKTEEMTAALQKTRTKDKDGEKSYGDLKKELNVLSKAFAVLKKERDGYDLAIDILKKERQDLETSNQKWEEAYDALTKAHEALQSSYELAWKANETLQRELAALKSEAGLSDEIKRQFVEAMEDALTNFGAKWMKVNEAQQQIAKYTQDILKS